MRTYRDEGRPKGTLAEFTPRYEPPPDERSRTLSTVFAEALGLLYQDIAEYGFAATIGAVGAALAAVLLATTGGFIGQALVAPAVFGIAALTYANTCAAIRRALDNLEPESLLAFFAVLARLPAIAAPLTLPLVVSGVAVLAGTIAARWTPDSVVTLAVIIAFAMCGLSSFQRALYVPALFARNVSFSQARTLGGNAMRKAGALVGACFCIAMAPAALIAMAALSTQFHPVATAAAAFVFTMSMPVAAALASLIYEAVTPPGERSQRKSAHRRWDTSDDDAVAARLTRRMR
jgi:hypothetical protein